MFSFVYINQYKHTSKPHNYAFSIIKKNQDLKDIIYHTCSIKLDKKERCGVQPENKGTVNPASQPN